jgi:hypothetical protein
MGFFSNVTNGLISDAIQRMGTNPAYRIGGGINAINNLLHHGDVLGVLGLAEEFGLRKRKGLDILGGVTVNRTIALHREVMGIRWERKNLFLIEVLDVNPLPEFIAQMPPILRAPMMQGAAKIKSALNQLGSVTAGISSALLNNAMGLLSGAAKFNLYAMDVSYDPITIGGDAVNIGSAVIDALTQTERVEISVTVRDDEFGTIKKWADGKASQTARADGTFGVPADYGLNIRILHGFMGDETALGRGYSQTFVCRVSGISIQKSRADSGLSEYQIKFTQMDTTR